MGLQHDYDETQVFSDFNYEEEDDEIERSHKKRIRRQLEERLERKRLKEELEDEWENEFDWGEEEP